MKPLSTYFYCSHFFLGFFWSQKIKNFISLLGDNLAEFFFLFVFPVCPAQALFTSSQLTKTDPDGVGRFTLNRMQILNQCEAYGDSMLAPDGVAPFEFMVDIWCERTVRYIQLVNTHNGNRQDRWEMALLWYKIVYWVTKLPFSGCKYKTIK